VSELGDFDFNGIVDGLDFLLWQRDQGVGSLATWEANYGIPNSQLPGDFNGNGIVDGEDFLLWQLDPSVGPLSDWEANYGMVAPLSASSAAVPERPSPSRTLLGNVQTPLSLGMPGKDTKSPRILTSLTSGGHIDR